MNYKLSVAQMKSKSKPLVVSGLLLINYFALILQLSPCWLTRPPEGITPDRFGVPLHVLNWDVRSCLLEEPWLHPQK
jgi:hypothetical protein